MENKVPGFVLYLDQQDVIKELTDQEAGILFKAIFEYVETEKEPKLKKMLKLVFLQFKNRIDKDKKKYEQKCAKNKENAEKYWKNKKMQTNTNAYDRIQTNTNIKEKENKNKKETKKENKTKTKTKISSNISNDILSDNNNTPKGVCNQATLDNNTHTCHEVVNCFNKVGVKESCFTTKKEFHFKETKQTKQLIQDLLDQGYTKENIFDVIFLKYDQWIENNDKNKIDMSTYYRPKTVLGENFEEYYQEAQMKEIG